MKKVAYAKMPVSQTEKKDLVAKGYKILAKQFAPTQLRDGDIMYETEADKAAKKASKPKDAK